MAFIQIFLKRAPTDEAQPFKRVFKGNLDNTPRIGELVYLSDFVYDGGKVGIGFKVIEVHNNVHLNTTHIYLEGSDYQNRYPEV